MKALERRLIKSYYERYEVEISKREFTRIKSMEACNGSIKSDLLWEANRKSPALKALLIDEDVFRLSMVIDYCEAEKQMVDRD